MGLPQQLHITTLSNEDELQALSSSYNQQNDKRDIGQIAIKYEILSSAFVLIL